MTIKEKLMKKHEKLTARRDELLESLINEGEA